MDLRQARCRFAFESTPRWTSTERWCCPSRTAAVSKLTSRQTACLVQRLQASADPAVRHEVLADPLRYVATEKPSGPRAEAADPRLSETGNRLRRLVLRWEGLSSQLVRHLSGHAPAGLKGEEAGVLGPLVHRAVDAGRRATEQLEAIESDSGLTRAGAFPQRPGPAS